MTTATTTLTEFLLARIAEDEREVSGQGPEKFEIPWVRKVLAECEAKRRIVEWCEVDGEVTVHPSEVRLVEGALHRVLEELAAVYSDHPDYREEWRP